MLLVQRFAIIHKLQHLRFSLKKKNPLKCEAKIKMLAEYPDAESKYQGWKEWRSGQFYGHLVFLQLDELQCHSHKGCSCLEALTGLLHKVRCTLRWSQETFRNERTRMKLFLQALPPEEALLSPLNPNHLQILCRCRAENFKF